MEYSDVEFIQHRVAINLERAVPVTVGYTTWPAGTLVDGTTQSKVADDEHQPTPGTLVARAFVHHITAQSVMSVKQYNEVEVGDAIVAFGADVDFSGKEDFQFTFDGATWVQKQVSAALAMKWGSLIGEGVRLFQVFLVRKAT